MLHANVVVPAFVALSSVAMLLQTVPVSMDKVSQLTLDGALILAVIALWRVVNRKDDQIVTLTQKMTEVTVAATATMATITKAIDELKETFEERHSALPCQLIQVESPHKKSK